MATFNDMVNEVTVKLSGYGLRNDATTYVTTAGGFSNSALSFNVANADVIGRGIIEVDDELIWVDAANSTTGTITIPPYGRGYLGTTPMSHAANAKVTINPSYTRNDIKTAINDTIQAVYPSLFAVSSTTFKFNPSVTTYSLPNNLESIISVSYRKIGPEKKWVPIRRYSIDSGADVEEFNSNNSITLGGTVDVGSTVKIQYTKMPDPLEIDFDDFGFTTGLPDSAKDVIVLGAVYRILSMVEPGRLTFTSPDAAFVSDRIQYGSGSNVIRTLFALYQQRLNDESNKLIRRFPIRSYYKS